jgi:hypothetical protein
MKFLEYKGYTQSKQSTFLSCTNVPWFSRGLSSRPHAKSKNPRFINRFLLQNNIFVFLVFFLNFLCTNSEMGTASFFLKLLEHHVRRLENLLESPYNLGAPIHRRGRIMYFYFWGDTADLRTGEVRPRKKREMSVHFFVSTQFFPFCVTSECMLVHLHA